MRASDFYGPGVRNSAFGDRVVPNMIAGKKVSMIGSLHVAHSVSYMPYIASTLVAVLTQPPRGFAAGGWGFWRHPEARGEDRGALRTSGWSASRSARSRP